MLLFFAWCWVLPCFPSQQPCRRFAEGDLEEQEGEMREEKVHEPRSRRVFDKEEGKGFR